MPYDTFHVQAIEGRNVAACDKSGTSDPYCVITTTFNTQKFKTTIHKKTLTPRWDQEFKFITSRTDGQVTIAMWDHNRIEKDTFMGQVNLSLSDYADGKQHDKWIPLTNEPEKYKKSKTPGEVHLKIWFSGPPEPKVEKKDEQTSKQDSKPVEKKEDKKPVTIEEKYDMKKVLGRGAFSVVKEAVRKSNGKRYAVKCITKKLIDKKELALLEREIDIMKKLDHPNIIQLMEVIDSPDTLYLVLEFAEGGELFDEIVNKGFYSEADAVYIAKQILEAIKYVHDLGIAHRDLKPENLLLSMKEGGKKDFIKIADFGLSKEFGGSEKLQTSCGTPDYVAPEVLSGDIYDKEVDLWSIGVIIYVLLCGFPPFYGDTQKELFERIASGTYDFPDPEWKDVSHEAKNFIKHLLVVDPADRYTAEQALNDPWMKMYSQPEKQKDLKRLETFSVKKFKEYTQKYKEQANQMKN